MQTYLDCECANHSNGIALKRVGQVVVWVMGVIVLCFAQRREQSLGGDIDHMCKASVK